MKREDERAVRDHLTAGLQHAPDLARGSVRVDEVLEHGAGDDEIDRRIAERQVVRIADDIDPRGEPQVGQHHALVLGDAVAGADVEHHLIASERPDGALDPRRKTRSLIAIELVLDLDAALVLGQHERRTVLERMVDATARTHQPVGLGAQAAGAAVGAYQQVEQLHGREEGSAAAMHALQPPQGQGRRLAARCRARLLASRRLSHRAERERLRQQHVQRRLDDRIVVAAEYDVHRRAELGQHLTARATRVRRLREAGRDRDRPDTALTRGDGRADRRAFRTDRQAVARVLDVATYEYAAVVGEHRRPHRESRRRRVCARTHVARSL